jgi:hypothetical protein
MLFAPGQPVRADVGLGAFFEGRQHRLDFDRPRLLAGYALLLNDVDAWCAAITLHAQARRVACETCLFERHILERSESVPALLPVFPVSIRPVFRRGAGDDEIETTAIGIFARPHFALDVQCFELSSHVPLQ